VNASIPPGNDRTSRRKFHSLSGRDRIKQDNGEKEGTAETWLGDTLRAGPGTRPLAIKRSPLGADSVDLTESRRA
jgi:hypothetical protein